MIYLPSSTLHLRDIIYSYIHCKWTIGSPDMAIFVGIMLTKSTSGEIKDFRSKSKKIISYIWVMCFLILGSHCMLHGNRVFFSIPYLPPSKPALLTLFFREIWTLFFVAHFGYNFIVYILVDYCLFMLPSKSVIKKFAQLSIFVDFSNKNP